MSEREKMQNYILRTKIRNYDRYTIRMNHYHVLLEMAEEDLCNALCFAFDYGMAKGFRAAKKEATI